MRPEEIETGICRRCACNWVTPCIDEEQRLRMGDLKSRAVNITVELDYEAYIAGLEHAKETKLMPEELVE